MGIADGSGPDIQPGFPEQLPRRPRRSGEVFKRQAAIFSFAGHDAGILLGFQRSGRIAR
jgi:hypothetical protein